MSYYPDNIRSFDHDPRSPFFVDTGAENIEAHRDNVGPAYALMGASLEYMLTDTMGAMQVKREAYTPHLSFLNAVRDYSKRGMMADFTECYTQTDTAHDLVASLHDMLDDEWPELFEDEEIDDYYSRQMRRLRTRIERLSPKQGAA